MKYILDTHILLWWLDNNKKLSKDFRLKIASSENIILVSAVSIWEIEIKRSLKKLSVQSIGLDLIEECQFTELPIKIEHTLHLKNLANYHNDPFDRLLICQAVVENAILITEDKLIKQYDVKCL